MTKVTRAKAGKAKKPKKPKKPTKPAKPVGGISYGVLRGAVTGGARDKNPDKPHYNIKIKAGGESFSAVVNVESADKSEVLFFADADVFSQVPELAKLWKAKVKKLEALPEGWTPLPDHKAGTALDYVREKYVEKSEMTHLPFDGPGANDDVQDTVDFHVKRAKEQGASIFVFGAQFPGGVHDVHMNQGNSGKWKKDNGIFQDGGVVLVFPSGRHVAMLFAFQTQSWKTDDKGNPK